ALVLACRAVALCEGWVLLLMLVIEFQSLDANRNDFIPLSSQPRLARHCSVRKLLMLAPTARVVEWQTRTFEGRMPKGMRVQVPPRAFQIALEQSGKEEADTPSPRAS